MNKNLQSYFIDALITCTISILKSLITLFTNFSHQTNQDINCIHWSCTHYKANVLIIAIPYSHRTIWRELYDMYCRCKF